MSRPRGLYTQLEKERVTNWQRETETAWRAHKVT